MILWTVQPEEVYNNIIQTGVYRCDFSRSGMKDWKMQYDWLVTQMIKRIGEKPSGTDYPVWAWFKWRGRRKRPDLRSERWLNGWKGERFVCMEIDIPEQQVLLSDYDAWSIILLDGLLSDSEAENDLLEKQYSFLSEEKQKEMKQKNWERVFDLKVNENDWITRGSCIQATFWELHKEQIKKVWSFTAAMPEAREEMFNPYKPLTREDIIEQLSIARKHAEEGKVMDAHEASNRIREKYGL